jgi:hypothetical protein
MTSLHPLWLQSIISSTPVDLHHQRGPFLLNTSLLYPRHHLSLITRDLDYNRIIGFNPNNPILIYLTQGPRI